MANLLQNHKVHCLLFLHRFIARFFPCLVPRRQKHRDPRLLKCVASIYDINVYILPWNEPLACTIRRCTARGGLCKQPRSLCSIGSKLLSPPCSAADSFHALAQAARILKPVAILTAPAAQSIHRAGTSNNSAEPIIHSIA